MSDKASSAPARAVSPVGVNHLVLNVRDIEESHRFWTEIVGLTQVGELHPDAPRHRAGREPEPAAAGRVGLGQQPGGDQPRGNDDAEPGGLAGAARIPAGPRCQVQLAGQSRRDAQRLHQRPERLRGGVPLRATARDVGERHRRRDQLAGTAAERGAGSANRPYRHAEFRQAGRGCGPGVHS